MTKQRIDASLTIIGILAATAVLITSTIVTPGFAIKNFFNCMTDIANEHGKLALDDVHLCVHKEYSAYRSVPYGIFSHSFSGGAGSGGH